MGYATATQPKTTTSAADSFLGTLALQAVTGCLFGTEVSDAVQAAETATTIYTDRYSSSVAMAPQRTNGKVELGVHKTLSPVFGRQTRPAPDVDLKDLIPFWQKEPALQYRARRHACSL